MKSAVLERQGQAIRFNPTLLDLASHYHFEPRAAAPARGNEKGRVERAIRYIRDNFFAGRHFQCLDDLNEQANNWCHVISADRRCPENTDLTVRESFLQEQPRLIALPDNPFDTREHKPVKAQKTPYIRFDLNDYSIPHRYVQKCLTVNACLKTVRIIDGDELIAEHPRSFSKGEQIENEQHITALWLAKTNAKDHRGQDRLAQASSYSQDFLQQAIERGHLLKSTINQLNQLLDDYGSTELHVALGEAIKQQSAYPAAVQQILEQRREHRQQPSPIAVSVPEKVKHYQVKAAKLSDYDKLGEDGGDEKEGAKKQEIEQKKEQKEKPNE